jgi:hypothetical protein
MSRRDLSFGKSAGTKGSLVTGEKECQELPVRGNSFREDGLKGPKPVVRGCPCGESQWLILHCKCLGEIGTERTRPKQET